MFYNTNYKFNNRYYSNIKVKKNIDNNKYSKNINNKYKLNLYLFENIIQILNEKPINSQTQLEIEEFLYNQYSSFISEKEGVKL